MTDGRLPRVPLVRLEMTNAEVDAATRVIRSGWLTQGPEVHAFETELAAAVGASHAVAVSSCTVALELALRCVGVSRGDDVVTVSHSFVATANCIVALGARPVFADIDRASLGMSPEALERAITPKTKCVLAVHQIGIACDLERIAAVAAARGIPVVEDAACAIGAAIRWGGRWARIGRPHGTLACFSFHPRKVVTTGDGGMITTADEGLARRLRLLRQHAMSIPDTVRHPSDRVIFEEYVEPAFNHRMTDLQAAVGRPQLARLDAIIAERRRLADVYGRALADHPVVAPPREPPWARSNWQSYAVSLRAGGGPGQVEVMQFLMDRGVSVKRGVSNSHQEPAYADRSLWACGPSPCAGCASGARCERLHESESARDGTILIPLFHGMTPEEQGRVLAAFDALRVYASGSSHMAPT